MTRGQEGVLEIKCQYSIQSARDVHSLDLDCIAMYVKESQVCDVSINIMHKYKEKWQCLACHGATLKYGLQQIEATSTYNREFTSIQTISLIC